MRSTRPKVNAYRGMRLCKNSHEACGALSICHTGHMTTHGSGRFVLKEGAGLEIKQARLARKLFRYELGQMLGFANKRSAQDFVMRLEKGELASSAATMGHVVNACGILQIPLNRVARWERMA